MNITEFAEGRGVDRNTISMYIKRHPEVFEGHTKSVGKKVELDDIALKELEKKYPVLSSVMVVDGVSFEEHKRILTELAEIQKKYIQLQEEFQKSIPKLIDAAASHQLLEERQMQIQKLEDRLDRVVKEREELQEENNTLIQKVSELEHRSVWQMFFRKRE